MSQCEVCGKTLPIGADNCFQFNWEFCRQRAKEEIERLKEETKSQAMRLDDLATCANRPIERFLTSVGDEVRRAEGLHSPINSLHEGYAVILEELDEFWEEVRKKREERDLGAVREELVQTAAMCVRTAVNVLEERKR